MRLSQMTLGDLAFLIVCTVLILLQISVAVVTHVASSRCSERHCDHGTPRYVDGCFCLQRAQ